MKPTENDAKAASVPVTGSKDGKKTSLKTRAAAVPKMKKSYHSIVVPMRLAKATLRVERRMRLWCDVLMRILTFRRADMRRRRYNQRSPQHCRGRSCRGHHQHSFTLATSFSFAALPARSI